MVFTLKKIIKNVTPPIISKMAYDWWRRGKSNGADSGWVHGVEQPSAFYDQSFGANAHWCRHYTESHYYPVWSIVADRMRRLGVDHVLDIGCGPGQVALLLFDKGVSTYLGLDFSTRRIEQARKACPFFEFEVADVFETSLLQSKHHDCVLIMEFLEHVDRDLDVLRKLSPGSYVIATVPNFPSTGHVRYFETVQDVELRYAPLFSSLDVMEHLGNKKGRKYFLMEGRLQ